ncbi:zinc knuckle domain-containing protein [Hirsutella rhossiliensis]
MIQALESAYGNPNELSEALDRLQRLQFTVNGKTDIVDFLAEFDYLTATGHNSLLTKTRDESVTYEVFYCSDYRQDSEQDRLDPITSRDAGRALTDDEKRVHWDNGTCFICGKTGHLSRDCPDRTHAVSRVASVPVPANDSDQDSGNE